MLYLVGGASRAGKSTLAGRLCASHGVAWFGLDLLRMGLCRGAPQLGIDPNNDNEEDARRLWPIVREICQRLIDDGRPYLIEGVSLDVAIVAAYAAERAGSVRTCFLGHAGADADAMWSALRHRGKGLHDWLSDHDDDFVRGHLAYSIRHSGQVRDACAAAGLAYFDTGADFEAGLSAAETFLME